MSNKYLRKICAENSGKSVHAKITKFDMIIVKYIFYAMSEAEF